MPPRRYKVDVSNQQARLKIAVRKLQEIVRAILEAEEIPAAEISIAVVDDPTMHQLNRQYLQHDYPTDVLSFVLHSDEESLEGEIIVSADTAATTCAEYGWSAFDELTLYVIHGTLHLVGYDDHSPRDRKQMRAKEAEYLAMAGLTKAE